MFLKDCSKGTHQTFKIDDSLLVIYDDQEAISLEQLVSALGTKHLLQGLQ